MIASNKNSLNIYPFSEWQFEHLTTLDSLLRFLDQKSAYNIFTGLNIYYSISLEKEFLTHIKLWDDTGGGKVIFHCVYYLLVAW